MMGYHLLLKYTVKINDLKLFNETAANGIFSFDAKPRLPKKEIGAVAGMFTKL